MIKTIKEYRHSPGNVNYLYSAPTSGDMTFANGTTVTVLGKELNVSDINRVYIADTAFGDNTVAVTYSGNSAKVAIDGNAAPYLTVTIGGGPGGGRW